MDSAQGRRNVSGIAGGGRRALRKFQRATTLDSINHRGDKKERGKEKGIGVVDEKKEQKEGDAEEEKRSQMKTLVRAGDEARIPILLLLAFLPPFVLPCHVISREFHNHLRTRKKGKEGNVPLRVLRSCFQFELLPPGRQEQPRGHFGAQLTMAAAATDTGEIPA